MVITVYSVEIQCVPFIIFPSTAALSYFVLSRSSCDSCRAQTPDGRDCEGYDAIMAAEVVTK